MNWTLGDVVFPNAAEFLGREEHYAIVRSHTYISLMLALCSRRFSIASLLSVVACLPR